MSTALTDLMGGSIPLWVVNRPYVVGKCVISTTDYQTYLCIVNVTSATDPSADPTKWRAFGARAIKSIQRGVSSHGNITVSSVNTAKSELHWLGGYNNFASVITVPNISLTSSTNILVSGSGGTTYCSWELIERY